MKHSTKLTTQKIVLTGLMAALTVAGSALRIVMPIDIGGNTAFHLGNSMCALSGLLLGPWLGGLAAGLGSALYDIINPAYGIADCWITFLTKGALGLVAGLVAWQMNKSPSVLRGVVGSAAGSVTYALLYFCKTYFYSGLLIKGLSPNAAWLTVIAKIPATTFNAVIAVIIAGILYPALCLALRHSGLLPNFSSDQK